MTAWFLLYGPIQVFQQAQINQSVRTTTNRLTPVQVSLLTKIINTVNWSVNDSAILWENGNTKIPSITQIEDKVDIFTLIYKTGTWYGINAGQNR